MAGGVNGLDRFCGSTYTGPVAAGTVNDLEALSFCFEPLSGRPVPAGGAETQGLFAFHDRQGALAEGLHGLNPRNTDSPTRKALEPRGAIPSSVAGVVNLDRRGGLEAPSPDPVKRSHPLHTLFGVGGGFVRNLPRRVD